MIHYICTAFHTLKISFINIKSHQCNLVESVIKQAVNWFDLLHSKWLSVTHIYAFGSTSFGLSFALTFINDIIFMKGLVVIKTLQNLWLPIIDSVCKLLGKLYNCYA